MIRMDTIITKEAVATAVYEAIPHLACELPADILAGLAAALEREEAPRGRAVLSQLVENARIARTDHVPICQDTGTVWVSLEVGPGVLVPADVFAGVDDAVARAYDEARLRKSVVRDAILDRANTGDNTPAFCDIHPVDEPGAARLRIMLKGGGSDNASRVIMLPPGAGRAGIVEEVVRCVREKGANACPPLVIGVGVGGTFDKVAGLAKRALMRPIDEPVEDARAGELERELLAAVNASGVGPGGLGGATAALAVRVATAPCHIAALPLAINMGCSAMRRATVDLVAQPAGASDGADGDSATVDPANGSLSTPKPDDAPSEGGETVCAQIKSSCDRSSEAHEAEGRAAERRVSEPSDGASSGTCGQIRSSAAPIRLTLPLDRARLRDLKAGQACLLTGPMYTLRDAGHIRLMEELAENGGALPYGLDGQAIFYAGPTPSAAGRPFGAVGPTTASRMDFAAPALHRAGIAATVGKGHRSAEVRAACAETDSVYFVACGGAAALLARCVASSETVAYADLGTEALRRIEVVDFPVFVGVDTDGDDVYELI